MYINLVKYPPEPQYFQGFQGGYKTIINIYKIKKNASLFFFTQNFDFSFVFMTNETDQIFISFAGIIAVALIAVKF